MAFDPNGPVVPTNGPSTDPMDMITRSAKLHGNATLTPEDTAYWMGKWNEWGKGDPTYFWKRLMDPPGPPAGAESGNDPLVYKTLPQVSAGLTPQLPSYGGAMKPGAAFDSAPPESRIFGAAGGGSNLDPRAVQRDALVKMLGRRG